MLVIKNIAKQLGTYQVLSGVTFALGTGQKAALVGPNGVGKSTLLRIIAGLEPMNKGTIQKAKHAGIGYLAQEVVALSGETIDGYARRLAGLEELERLMEDLGKHLDDPSVAVEYDEVTEQYKKRGGYDFEARLRTLLDGLGMREVPIDRPLAELSGGQKGKANLIAVLLRGVDILLLDEPTNNLDLPALLWLETFLAQSGATCLIASHDRAFLDRVVTKVFEIDWFTRSIVAYTGNWSEYARIKAMEERHKKELYRLQQEELKRLKKTAAEKNEWSQNAENNTKEWSDGDKMGRNFKREKAARKHAAAASALESRAEQTAVLEKPDERDPLEIRFDPVAGTEEGSRDIHLHEVVAGYGTAPSTSNGLFSPSDQSRSVRSAGRQEEGSLAESEQQSFQIGPISLEIPFGRRVAILGRNGSGKSTLLKAIVGRLEPLSGEVARGSSIVLGDFAQEHETLPREWLPAQLFAERAGLEDRSRVALLLHQCHLGLDAMRKKISEFSPGERARLLLALYAEMRVNVLVLDEPTNHLDVEAIRVLEEVLERYQGTVILVTHDRTFIEHVSRMETFVLEEGTLQPIGDYTDYAVRLTQEAKRTLRRLPKN